MMQSSRDLDLSLYFSSTSSQSQSFAGIFRQELLLMHRSATSAFLCAHSSVPQLVASEAPPMLFALNYTNTREAALRLAGYWSNRSLLLGSKAYRPIQESESLMPVDNRILLSTVISPTLISAADAGNLGLLVVIDASLIQNFDQEDNMRCLFLKLHEGLRSAVSKITLAFLRVEGASITSLGSFINGAAAVITNGMPFSVEKVYVAGLESANSPPLFSFAVSQILQSRLCQDCVVASSSSPKELSRKLEGYGLAVAIPLSQRTDPVAPGPAAPVSPPGRAFQQMALVEPNVGISAPQGSRSDAALRDSGSFAQQTGLDDIQSLEASASCPSPASPSSTEKESSVGSSSKGKAKASSDEEKRKRNAIYSRRKYVRKKIELEVLEQECGRLRSQNYDLKAESERLEFLVKQANAIVDGGLLDQKPMAIGTPSTVLQQPNQQTRDARAVAALQAMRSSAARSFPPVGAIGVGSPVFPRAHAEAMVELQGGQAPAFPGAAPGPGTHTTPYFPAPQPTYHSERVVGALNPNGEGVAVGGSLLNSNFSSSSLNSPELCPIGTTAGPGAAVRVSSSGSKMSCDLVSLMLTQPKGK